MQLLLLIFFSTVLIHAQINIDPVILNSDSLVKKSVTLSKPWKYSKGDDILWAEKEFVDSDWDTIRTKIATTDSLFDSFNGISWFRRTIIIDSALYNNPVALSMWHYGASQIYLNGKLVHEFGKVANNLADEKIYQPFGIPINLLFSNDSVNVIAVRYSNFHATNDKKWYNKWFSYAGFQVRISEINNSILDTVQNVGSTLSINIGISAIFLALSFLYFVLFFFYSMKKENLYYSFFTFFISLSFLLQMLPRFNQSSFNYFAIVSGIRSFASIFVFPAYLTFIYSIFYNKLPKQIWIILISTIIITVFAFYLPSDYDDLINYTISAFVFIITFESLRVIFIAIKNKKKNAWIIGAGVILFAILIITMFIVIGLLGGGNINSTWGVIFFFLGLISLPISMSVYLARNIAVTNKELEQQVENVKLLSAKQLEQERKNAELKLQAELAEAENIRKTKELEEARELQLSMLPKKLPDLPNLDIAVYMKTATEVGGDYYDFNVGIDGTLTVVLGDATGHGMRAGTMVTATKTLFGSYANDENILNTFHEMTRCLKELNFNMLSMCLALVKIKGNKITMSSAGIPPILVYRANEDKVEEFVIKGMPLGTIEKFPYKTVTTNVNSGDVILLMSDGFPELMNEEKQMYGYSSVSDYFSKIEKKDPEQIIRDLSSEIDRWKKDGAPDDDITFVTLKFK